MSPIFVPLPSVVFRFLERVDSRSISVFKYNPLSLYMWIKCIGKKIAMCIEYLSNVSELVNFVKYYIQSP